jgi:hypothetical protein
MYTFSPPPPPPPPSLFSHSPTQLAQTTFTCRTSTISFSAWGLCEANTRAQRFRSAFATARTEEELRRTHSRAYDAATKDVVRTGRLAADVLADIKVAMSDFVTHGAEKHTASIYQHAVNRVFVYVAAHIKHLRDQGMCPQDKDPLLVLGYGDATFTSVWYVTC